MAQTKTSIGTYVAGFGHSVNVPPQLFDMLLEFRNKEKERILNDCIRNPRKYLE